MNPELLKYPIGHFEKPEKITREHIVQWIEEISTFPERLKSAVENLTDAQLDTPYRPEGWTIRQVVHHCADSHANSIIRFKLALTEDAPVIKPYYEDRWAELEDSRTMPVESALWMLKGTHARWTVLLKSLSEEQLFRTFIHPGHRKSFRLDENTGVYAWHGNHHLAQITGLKNRMEWE